MSRAGVDAARAALDRWMAEHWPSLEREISPLAADLTDAEAHELVAYARRWAARRSLASDPKTAASVAAFLVSTTPRKPGDCPNRRRGPRCHPDCPGPDGDACRWADAP